jgi:hypothetical protein
MEFQQSQTSAMEQYSAVLQSASEEQATVQSFGAVHQQPFKGKQLWPTGQSVSAL